MKLTRLIFSTFLILMILLTACDQNKELPNHLLPAAAAETNTPESDPPTAETEPTEDNHAQNSNEESQVEATNENKGWSNPMTRSSDTAMK